MDPIRYIKMDQSLSDYKQMRQIMDKLLGSKYDENYLKVLFPNKRIYKCDDYEWEFEAEQYLSNTIRIFVEENIIKAWCNC